MSNQTGSYEPLTSQNATLVLVDHQVGLMTGVRDCSIGELRLLYVDWLETYPQL
jgi:hypothetical protein